MKKWTLIVGNNPILLQTRAELIQEWQIVTASSRDAGEAITARAYDLLIFSQTVLEEAVNGLTSQAQARCPHLNVIAISRAEDEKRLASATYRVDLRFPNGLRIAVSRLLSHIEHEPPVKSDLR